MMCTGGRVTYIFIGCTAGWQRAILNLDYTTESTRRNSARWSDFYVLPLRVVVARIHLHASNTKLIERHQWNITLYTPRRLRSHRGSSYSIKVIRCVFVRRCSWTLRRAAFSLTTDASAASLYTWHYYAMLWGMPSQMETKSSSEVHYRWHVYSSRFSTVAHQNCLTEYYSNNNHREVDESIRLMASIHLHTIVIIAYEPMSKRKDKWIEYYYTHTKWSALFE